MSPDVVPWLAALALLLGILALLLELFITGFGVAGVAGIILIAWGVVLLNVDDFTITFKSLVIGLTASIIVFILGLKLLSRYNFWQRLSLGKRQLNDEGYRTSRGESAGYAGQEGTALTPLRPSGAAEVGGERLDVVSEGGFIAAGARVVVVRVEGLRIVVRALD